MKRIRNVIVIAVTFITTCAVCDEATEFARALNMGAEAKITLRIVNEGGVPIPDTKVEFGFWNNYSQGGFKNFILRSDVNGECVVSGRCNGTCVWNVTKTGYYRSHAEWSLTGTQTTPKVVDGKWQPYGEKREIVLKKIVSPVDLSCVEYKIIKCPSFDEWLGFDLECCSWVKPYGDGLYSDLLIKLHEEHRGDNAFYASMELSFTNNPYAGAYVLRKYNNSEMKSIYHADTNVTYQSKLMYSLGVDDRGKRTENELTADSYLVFRTRTEVDKNGKLISAHYGKIYGRWGFYGGMRAEAFFFNTTPNDTNLEDAKTANRSFQRQRQHNETPYQKRRKSLCTF